VRKPTAEDAREHVEHIIEYYGHAGKIRFHSMTSRPA
jgi:hypothetical protein